MKNVELPMVAAHGVFPERQGARREAAAGPKPGASSPKPGDSATPNLDAFAIVCQILSEPADNLWTFELSDGRGMRKAMDFMFPYIADKSRWPHKPDVQYHEDWPVRHPSLLFAGLSLDRPAYVEAWRRLDGDPTVEEVIRNFVVRQPVLWTAESAISVK